MEKIELKHIVDYLPYDLEFKDPETVCPGTMVAIVAGMPGLIFYEDKDDINYFDLHRIKPLLVPLSAKIMEQVLIEVSMFDLSDCHFEYGFDDNMYWCNAINDRVIDAVQYDGNYFEIMDNDTMKPLAPQYSGFEAFHKLHIDYMELIDAGLALNKLDYAKS